MLAGFRTDGSWFHYLTIEPFSINVSNLSYTDIERVIEAIQICRENDCGDLFKDRNPLDVVDLLVHFGMMEKKKKWWQIWSKRN